MTENTFEDILENKMAYTEKGAKALKCTDSALLDFFSQCGAMRGMPFDKIEQMWCYAWVENPILALKCLFHVRDIKNGLGERALFRKLFRYTAMNLPDVINKNMEYVPEFGRWDDLFCLVGTPCEETAFAFMAKQLIADIVALKKDENVSLLGKWAASENCSSLETRELGAKFRSYLKFTPKEYRKTLSALREKIRIVERSMCANKWNDIDYQKVPSRASMIYRHAFWKHDGERYDEYLSKVESGEAKINASVLYPHDLVRAIWSADKESTRTLEAQWKALPDYLKDNPHNAVAVCDVSGSMSSCANSISPMDVALSLSIYFSERNNGIFKNAFITFSENPTIQRIVGNTLKEKVCNLSRADWDMTTNLQSVFDLILSTAIENNVPYQQLPSKIYIISDMQFDQACPANNKTNFEIIRDKYAHSGYTMPGLVFWNVRATGKNAPVHKDERGVALVSGCSPIVFKYIFDGIASTPYELMLETLNNERYAMINA